MKKSYLRLIRTVKICTSITDCKAYGDEHGIFFAGPKHIYTIEEATLLTSPKGNTFKLRYR